MKTLKYVVLIAFSFAIVSTAFAAQDQLLLDQIHKSQKLKTHPHSACQDEQLR